MVAPVSRRSDLTPNDIDTLASYVDGMDPTRYFDSQVRDDWLAASARWPLLMAVLYPDLFEQGNEH